MAAWAGDVAAQLLAAASHRGCQQDSGARGCGHPLSAVSIPSLLTLPGEQLCASLAAAEARLTAVLQRMLVPELPLAWVFDGFAFCSFYFPPTRITLVSFNLIASFSDRLSQEQCK